MKRIGKIVLQPSDPQRLWLLGKDAEGTATNEIFIYQQGERRSFFRTVLPEKEKYQVTHVSMYFVENKRNVSSHVYVPKFHKDIVGSLYVFAVPKVETNLTLLHRDEYGSVRDYQNYYSGLSRSKVRELSGQLKKLPFPKPKSLENHFTDPWMVDRTADGRWAQVYYRRSVATCQDEHAIDLFMEQKKGGFGEQVAMTKMRLELPSSKKAKDIVKMLVTPTGRLFSQIYDRPTTSKSSPFPLQTTRFLWKKQGNEPSIISVFIDPDLSSEEQLLYDVAIQQDPALQDEFIWSAMRAKTPWAFSVTQQQLPRDDEALNDDLLDARQQVLAKWDNRATDWLQSERGLDAAAQRERLAPAWLAAGEREALYYSNREGGVCMYEPASACGDLQKLLQQPTACPLDGGAVAAPVAGGKHLIAYCVAKDRVQLTTLSGYSRLEGDCAHGQSDPAEAVLLARWKTHLQNANLLVWQAKEGAVRADVDRCVPAPSCPAEADVVIGCDDRWSFTEELLAAYKVQQTQLHIRKTGGHLRLLAPPGSAERPSTKPEYCRKSVRQASAAYSKALLDGSGRYNHDHLVDLWLGGEDDGTRYTAQFGLPNAEAFEDPASLSSGAVEALNDQAGNLMAMPSALNADLGQQLLDQLGALADRGCYGVRIRSIRLQCEGSNFGAKP